MERTVIVCCHQTCTPQNSKAVLKAFQEFEGEDITIIRGGCLGQCGSGPMVKVMPDKVWYAHVQVKDVQAIAKQHLQKGKPVKRLLYWKFHQQSNTTTIWIVIFLSFWTVVILIFWILASQTNYFA